MKRRFLSLFAGVMTLAMVFSAGATAAYAEETPISGTEGEIVVTKGKFEMIADGETGLFKITDKSADVSWSSVPENLEDDEISKKNDKLQYGSQLILKYVFNEEFASTGKVETGNSKVMCVNNGTVGVQKINGGIKVSYNFERLGITIPVEYTLTDNGFKAVICADEIEEGKEYSIVEIHLLPSFAAGDWNDEGYIFVPDGSGAIIGYNCGTPGNEYEAVVYGEELATNVIQKKLLKETVRMPVFGSYSSKENKGFIGIIASGDTAASIRTLCGNSNCGYNMAGSILNYRFYDNDTLLSQKNTSQLLYRLSAQKYSLKDYTVEYRLLSGDNAGYIGMANAYRDYLINNKGLKQTASQGFLNVDVYGAFETVGNFLGIKYKKLISMTSYSEVSKLVEEFEKSGMDDVNLRYIGWSNDGIFNRSQLKKVKLLGVLGGKSDWKNMLNDLNAQDTNITFDADLLLLRKGRSSLLSSSVFDKKMPQYQYMPSVHSTKLNVDSWYLLSPSHLTSTADKYLKSLVSNKIDDISLSTLTNTIYSDFNTKRGMYRTDVAADVEQVLKTYKEKDVNISGETANAYAIPYLSKIYKSPVKSSGYKFYTKEIPFYQIVLHSYVPMTVDAAQNDYYDDYNFLKAVETGSELLFNGVYGDSAVFKDSLQENLYSSSYELWIDKAARQYELYGKLFDEVSELPITDHCDVAENVTKTVFGNSVTVYVNYSDSDAVVEGITVPAKSFIKA